MDKIFSDIKNSVGSAMKKSGEIVELTKIKLAIADTKSELKSKFAALGEMTYKAQKGETIVDSDGIIAEIDELCEILDAQEAKLAALKKQKVCPKCEAGVDIDAAYCSKCGEKFADTQEEDDEYEVIETVEVSEE